MTEKRDFVLGMLVGSAIGAAVALLYAPQPGDMTRDMIKQKAGEAKDRAGELATTARDKASTVAGTISSTVTEKTTAARDSASHMVDQVKSTAQELVDRGRTLVETKKEQVAAAVEAGKQAYQEKRTELEADVQEDLEAPSAASGSSGTTPAV
jgi:gas vesicle protein